MQIFGKGRAQVHREELHGHRPFGLEQGSFFRASQNESK